MIAIAIDGPAGAGKSTLAQKIAKELEFIYVDTGALYRAIGFSAINKTVNIKEADQLDKLLSQTKVEIKFINNEQRVFLNGEDVSDKIRTPEVSMMASDISALPKVRDFLLDLQRDMAKNNNVLMDGRDIGTVVLPDAQIKIFLTASANCRAKRRYDFLTNEKGMAVDFDEVLSDIETRDYNDSNRAVAPLKPAADSIIVDTSDEELKVSFDKILKIIKERMV